jgi:hypothetical protein
VRRCPLTRPPQTGGISSIYQPHHPLRLGAAATLSGSGGGIGGLPSTGWGPAVGYGFYQRLAAHKAPFRTRPDRRTPLRGRERLLTRATLRGAHFPGGALGPFWSSWPRLPGDTVGDIHLAHSSSGLPAQWSRWDPGLFKIQLALAETGSPGPGGAQCFLMSWPDGRGFRQLAFVKNGRGPGFKPQSA